jgi:hypothetical protein
MSVQRSSIRHAGSTNCSWIEIRTRDEARRIAFLLYATACFLILGTSLPSAILLGIGFGLYCPSAIPPGTRTANCKPFWAASRELGCLLPLTKN